MDYQLAKELKDAGFPQNPQRHSERPDSWIHPDGDIADWVGASGGNPDDECYLPTLEELIEACPQIHDGCAFDMIVIEGEWIAWYEAPNREIKKTPEGLGKTPTEAVARLWLALNT